MSEAPPTPRALTPLLDLVRDDALEREYHEVATRGGTVEPERHPAARVIAASVIAVFGLLVTLAAVQTSRNADVTEASRAQILDRIESTDRSLDSAQAALADLQAANAAAENNLVDLGGSLAETSARSRTLGGQTGSTAVTGPGIRITFEHLPSADPATEWVRDSDLAALVNGLWAAGAEAISINGQRINARGGIRNVGNNVEINKRVVGSPYTVLAIGNPDTLAANLLETTGGNEFFALAQQFGWNPEPRNAPELRIPAAPLGGQALTSAERLDDARRGEAQ
ncbi:DUF881 domain-containing protein [Nocardioides panacisoli]|uniref:DUF881 domain-containing protein n=1 Tax=Nocardioides panacisoli TaxID=627624 RepID=UPI001C625AB1|nr:DUF881 domain-containing protein [Nocardioides panacisoli]QYJ05121.1 DUF881 domain-containing protein [Nocardioides panacisoli]